MYDLFTEDPHNVFLETPKKFISSGLSMTKKMIESKTFRDTRANVDYNNLPSIDSLKFCTNTSEFIKNWKCAF